MPLTDPRNCLAYHQSRALTSHRDMSQVSCQQVVKAKNAFQAADKNANAKPERLAISFYALNQGMALIAAKRHAYEKLTPGELLFVEQYHELAGETAVRAFYYLLEICTREARHNSSLKGAKAAEFKAKIEKQFGPEIAAIHASVGSGEESIMKAFFDKTPDAPIGQYCKSLAWVYYHCKWPSNYGGPAWGNIADCLSRFVAGEFTAEMMLDTVWTLEHNTCAIFNKPNKLFAHFDSHGWLKRILDVQRSGQMVEMALYDKAVSQFVASDVAASANWIRQEFPGKIGTHVDWYKVEALGALGHYAAEKAQQSLTPEEKAAIEKQAAEAKAQKEAAEAVAKLAKEEAAKAAAEKLANQFTVMPGVTVEKTKMKRAA